MDRAIKALKPFADFWDNSRKVGEDRSGDIIVISDGITAARLSYGMIKQAAAAYRELVRAREA